MSDPRQQVLGILKTEDAFVVTSHENPDGDAMGAMSAMGHLLRALGKDFRLFNVSGPQEHYDWLRLPGPIHSGTADMAPFVPRWSIVLDCGERHRVGQDMEAILDQTRAVSIDHHQANSRFGEVNWVDVSKSATCEMLAQLAKDLGQPLSGPLGEALYLGILTDTGNFSYGNSTPEAFELCAEIVRLGLDPGYFTAQYQNQWTINRLRLWSKVLGQAKFYCRSRIGVAAIPAALLTATGAKPHDCEGLVESVRRVRGVRVALSMREKAPGVVKFSLRSQGEDNVQRIAKDFGGGGHKNASGGTIEADMDKAEAMLIEAVGRLLDLDDDEGLPCNYESGLTRD